MSGTEKTEKNPVGRPKAKPMLRVRMGESTQAELAEIAESYDMNVSEYVRAWAMQEIKKHRERKEREAVK